MSAPDDLIEVFSGSEEEEEDDGDLQIVGNRTVIQEVESEGEDGNNNINNNIGHDHDDIQVVQVVRQVRPSLRTGFSANVDDDEVQIIGQQRATVRLEHTPIYLPGGIVYTDVGQDDFYDDENDEDYVPSEDPGWAAAYPRFRDRQLGMATINNLIGRFLNRFFNRNPGNNFDDDLSQEIWSQVQSMENSELDRKFNTQKSYAEPFIAKANESVANLPDNYQSAIEKSKDIVCPLCGVTLGSGIPDDYITLVQIEKQKVVTDPTYEPVNYDDEATYSDAIQDYGCWAPYQLLPFISKVDIELSRKVYFAKCGHVFCGRCVQRIGSKPRKLSKSKKLPKNIHNPTVYAPSKCVVPNCRKQLVGGRFVEIYHNN